MTARKTSHEPTDWVKIINALGTVILTIMMAYFGVTQRVMKETVQQVKEQTDGNTTAHLLAIAISARALAVETNLPEHVKRAEEAESAWKTQAANQLRSEQTNP